MMKLTLLPFESILVAAAIGQLAIALINVRLDKLLKWEDELNGLSKLLREVFYVHKWFISITLIIFGIMTIRFAGDIATGATEMARWFAAAVGCFWAVRTVIQWCFYSWDHWRGKPRETMAHWTLTIAYGGCALVYFVVAFQ